MADLFAAAVAIVLPEEGPYSLSPGDPGGETKWGISRAAHPEIPDATWATFTRDDALAVYRIKYWDKNQCGAMPWCWALAVFDGEVNQGSVVAMAQTAMRLSLADGIVGPATLAAMAGAPQYDFEQFLGLRLLAYVNDSQFSSDGLGWFTRIINVAMNAALQPSGGTDA